MFDVGNTKSGVDAMSEEAWRISRGNPGPWKLVTFASPVEGGLWEPLGTSCPGLMDQTK